MKKKVWLVVAILLLTMLEGCADGGKRSESPPPVPPGKKQEEPEGQGEPKKPETGGERESTNQLTILVNPYVESVSVQGEHDELLYIYMRNYGDSVSTISKECFEWYLNKMYMGTVTEVFSGDREIIAMEWEKSEVLCIFLRNKSRFSIGDTIKVVMICFGRPIERVLSLEPKFFANSKIFVY